SASAILDWSHAVFQFPMQHILRRINNLYVPGGRMLRDCIACGRQINMVRVISDYSGSSS
ncbi:MAG: hypothetical protein V1262_10730, partial [Alphaproteobacteria bacterium]|nr:hypothetical protein [Alphaproteobacteria bacterium]